MDMKQIDDDCFAVSEQLVATVFASASHRERVALVLELATPIFNIVRAAVERREKLAARGAKSAPATGAAKKVSATPAKPRLRRTKAQIAADEAAKLAAAPVRVPTPPAPRPPATPAYVPPPPDIGMAPSPFGQPLAT